MQAPAEEALEPGAGLSLYPHRPSRGHCLVSRWEMKAGRELSALCLEMAFLPYGLLFSSEVPVPDHRPKAVPVSGSGAGQAARLLVLLLPTVKPQGASSLLGDTV